MNKLLVVISLLLSASVYAQLFSSEKSEEQQGSKVIGSITPKFEVSPREQVLGNLLPVYLSNYHYLKKPLDDDVSEKGFKLYIERLDYGKQFLLQKDVDTLEEYKDKMDDQLKSGNIVIISVAENILKKRYEVIEKHALDLLSKPFDFSKKETYQTDPEKRNYASTVEELKSRWERALKYEVLLQFLELKDEQEKMVKDTKDDKKGKKSSKKKSKKEKVLTVADLKEKARDKVKKRYEKVFKRISEEKKDDRLDKFYNSITRVYDPHTHYLMPEEKEDFDIDMKGKLMGIGALLREEGSYIKVDRIIPGSASWKGKELEAGDTILAVAQGKNEPVDIVDVPIRDAVKLIRGEKGTEVRLSVRKQSGTNQVIAIIRDEVILEESYVKGAVLNLKGDAKKVGYIDVPKFYRDFDDDEGRNCSDDVKAELLKFKKSKDIKGIILDLRGNGGGALKDAALMSGLFISEGPIVQVKDSSGRKEIYSDDDEEIFNSQPLIVLVDRFSASASEIVAAAMQDYGRAIIVGSSAKTHGKGTVQAIIDRLAQRHGLMSSSIGDLGAIKITIQMFFRVNGESTQFNGVVPDIELPDQYAYFDSGEESLDYAVPHQVVKSVKYNKWNKDLHISDLKKKSEARVEKNTLFKKVKESVEFYKERKENTERSLKLEDMVKFRDETNKKAEEFKNEKEIASIEVETFFKKRDDVEKERSKEFEKKLKKDPVIEETLYILTDMMANAK